MNLGTALVGLFISTLLLLTVAAAPKRPPNCIDKIVAFSHCLPYVSESPNNFTASVPPHCCDAISYVFNLTDTLCICYLLRKPSLYGFPLNHSRIVSLPSLCSATSVSVESICPSGGKQLPPLLNPTPGTSKPSHSGADNGSYQPSRSATSPLSSLPNSTEGSPNSTVSLPKSTEMSPSSTERSSAPSGESDDASSALTKIGSNGWYLPAALILLSYIGI